MHPKPAVTATLALALATTASAQMVEISNDGGGLTEWIQSASGFGRVVAPLGDVNGDGVPDVAVADANGVWGLRQVRILFLDPSGTVDSTYIVEGVDEDGLFFGTGVTGLGDLNQDGTPDIAISEVDQNGPCVHIMYLTPSGAPDSMVRIATPEITPFSGAPSAARLGRVDDLTGDGIPDLLLGDPSHGSGGRVFIFHILRDGTVIRRDELSKSAGTLSGPLSGAAWFGASVSGIEDLDGDGLPELLIGAPKDSSPTGGFVGAVWIVSVGHLGRTRWERNITNGRGGFVGPLVTSSNFGYGVADAGDRNGDGVHDLIVGASDTRFGLPGSVWLLNLASDGRVIGQTHLPPSAFPGTIGSGDQIGHSVGNLGDLNGDLVNDYVYGSPGGDDGVPDSGSIYIHHGFRAYFIDLQTPLFETDPDLQGFIFTVNAMNLEPATMQANIWVEFSGEDGEEDPEMEPVLLKAGVSTPLKVTGWLPEELEEGTQVTLCVGTDRTDIWAMTSFVIE